MLTANLQVCEPERLFYSPHSLSHDDGRRHLKHARSDVISSVFGASTDEIQHGGDLIVRQRERGVAIRHVRREQRHPASAASGQRG